MTYLETFRRKKSCLVPLLFDSRLGGAHRVMVHFQQLLGTACKESLISNKALVVGTSCVCVSSLCQRSSMTDDYDLRIWCNWCFVCDVYIHFAHVACELLKYCKQVLRIGQLKWAWQMTICLHFLDFSSHYQLWICARARGKPMAGRNFNRHKWPTTV